MKTKTKIEQLLKQTDIHTYGGRPQLAEDNRNHWREKGYVILQDTHSDIYNVMRYHPHTHVKHALFARRGSMHVRGSYETGEILHRRYFTLNNIITADGMRSLHNLLAFLAPFTAACATTMRARVRRERQKRNLIEKQKIEHELGMTIAFNIDSHQEIKYVKAVSVISPIDRKTQDGCVYKIDDKYSVVVRDGKGIVNRDFDLQTGYQASLDALIPAIVRESTSSRWVRQGDIYLHPVAGLDVERDGCLIESANVANTRHTVEGAHVRCEGYELVKGILHAPDHDDVIVETPHAVVTTSNSD